MIQAAGPPWPPHVPVPVPAPLRAAVPLRRRPPAPPGRTAAVPAIASLQGACAGEESGAGGRSRDAAGPRALPAAGRRAGRPAGWVGSADRKVWARNLHTKPPLLAVWGGRSMGQQTIEPWKCSAPLMHTCRQPQSRSSSARRPRDCSATRYAGSAHLRPQQPQQQIGGITKTISNPTTHRAAHQAAPCRCGAGGGGGGGGDRRRAHRAAAADLLAANLDPH